MYAESLKLGPAQLYSFHADSFAIALVLHVLVSALVGLLYGAMLPMFARRPIVLGGLIGPVLWSGLLYTMLGLLNPLLASHIDWPWFIASQVAFGIVAGFVVDARSRRCRRARTCHSPYAQGSKLRESLRREKTERSAREPISLSMCVRGAEHAALGLCSSPHGQPQKDSEAVAPEPDLGLRHSLRTKLRGLPRRARTRRSSDRAGRSGLSRHCRRSVNAQSHR